VVDDPIWSDEIRQPDAEQHADYGEMVDIVFQKRKYISADN